MISLGTVSLGARAAEEDLGSPRCEAVQDDQGEPGVVCDNLTDEQSMSLFNSQELDARRRCWRTCSFRLFNHCFRWHVVCRGRGWR
jgi:hypothetical protein